MRLVSYSQKSIIKKSLRAGVGNLVTITSHINCALSMVGQKIYQFYLKILPLSKYEDEWLLLMYHLSTCLSWGFVLTQCCTRKCVTKILMLCAISNVHTTRIWPAGCRFPIPALGDWEKKCVEKNLLYNNRISLLENCGEICAWILPIGIDKYIKF